MNPKNKMLRNMSLFFLMLGLLLILCSCESQITTPQEEGISGNYKSVAYQEGYETYDIQIEILQRGGNLSGRLIGSKTLSLNGTIFYDKSQERDRVNLYSDGKLILDVWTNPKGDYYPLHGSCFLENSRAIRFEKTGNLHNQGAIR